MTTDTVRPAAEVRPVDPSRSPQAFTQQRLDWVPWIEPLASAHARRGVLWEVRAGSPHVRLLARDPGVSGEHTGVDAAIFYGQGGLSRSERELTATVTSRLNGCVYGASVHSALSSKLSDRAADVQRLLDEGVGVRIDDRRDAITDFAAALSANPPTATAAHIDRLREWGLADQQISDIVHAAAFSSWANRLMLTLGEPEIRTP